MALSTPKHLANPKIKGTELLTKFCADLQFQSYTQVLYSQDYKLTTEVT